jgi:hypothetical protein
VSIFGTPRSPVLAMREASGPAAVAPPPVERPACNAAFERFACDSPKDRRSERRWGIFFP